MSDKIELAYKEVLSQINNEIQGYYFYVAIFRAGNLAKEMPVYTSSGTNNALDFEFHKKEAIKIYNQIILFMQEQMQAQPDNGESTAKRLTFP